MVPSFLRTTYLNSAIFDVVYGITVITDLDAGVDITVCVIMSGHEDMMQNI